MYFRPLKLIERAIHRVNGTHIPCYPTGFRRRVQHFAIALGWMSKGYQYDDRTLRQRLTNRSARYHFAIAFGASHSRAQQLAGN
jgi:hypothetical protein